MKGKEAYARIRFYNKSGARLYIPEEIKGSEGFRFRDGDVVRIVLKSESATELCVFPVEWWEMIDWKTMPDAFQKLPEKIRQKITKAGLI